MDPFVRDPDTVIVPGGLWGIDEFEHFSAYICQADRAFRDVEYLGFYAHRAIDPRFPRIIGRRTSLQFTWEEARRLRQTKNGEPYADVVEQALELGHRRVGERLQIVLLALRAGFTLSQPIRHPPEVGRGAWVQYQRYSRRDALQSHPSPQTTADLAEAGG